MILLAPLSRLAENVRESIMPHENSQPFSLAQPSWSIRRLAQITVSGPEMSAHPPKRAGAHIHGGRCGERKRVPVRTWALE